MTKAISTVLFCIIFFVAPLSGAAEFTVREKKFSFEIPKDWKQIAPNKNNFIIQGPPSKDSGHSVIFISNTGINGATFRTAPMQVTTDAYYEGRKNYITAKGGTMLEIVPYTIARGPANQEFHTVGVNYKLGTETYHEVSQFTVCNGSIFQIKSLDFFEVKSPNSAFSFSRGFKCVH